MFANYIEIIKPQRSHNVVTCYCDSKFLTWFKGHSHSFKCFDFQLSQVPPFENKVIVQKYWVISEQVDKTLLRQEVQEFCGQFPIYRLQEVEFNSTGEAEIDGGRTRSGK